MRKSLPKRIYIKYDVDRATKDYYLISSETKDELALGEANWVEVGEYQLVKTTQVRQSFLEKRR